MKLREITWKDVRHGSLDGFVGKVRLFTVFYDGLTPIKEMDGKPYILSVNLPGIKDRFRVADQEQGQKFANTILRHFLAMFYEPTDPNGCPDCGAPLVSDQPFMGRPYGYRLGAWEERVNGRQGMASVRRSRQGRGNHHRERELLRCPIPQRGERSN